MIEDEEKAVQGPKRDKMLRGPDRSKPVGSSRNKGKLRTGGVSSDKPSAPGGKMSGEGGTVETEND